MQILGSDEELRQKAVEAIILGWGLTAAVVSLLMVYPLSWLLPDMLRGFLYPQGRTSLMYLAVVCFFDVLFDVISTVLLTHFCRCDFSKVFGTSPFSRTLQNAYLSSLTVVWAPCALGNFGWVFQHMCVWQHLLSSASYVLSSLSYKRAFESPGSSG